MVKWFFLLLFITTRICAITYPVSPAEPTVSGETTKKQKSLSPKTNNIAVNVRLKLGTGDEIEGTIAMPNEITFSHVKNALTYNKTLYPWELKKITVNEYAARQGDNGLIEFEPASITITTTNKREYLVQGIFSFLKKITINTVDGSTTVFTFFADKWSDKTGWAEVSSKDKNYHRKNPHPQAVHEITILGVPGAAGDKISEP